MRDLLPLSRYEASVKGVAWRSSLVMAALWGIPMTTFLVISQGDLGLVASLSTGVLAALLFGFGWTLWMRRGMLRLIRRIYNGDPKIVPPAPAGPFDARLSCNLMLSKNFGVGGHLYLGEDRAVFMPHNRNLPKHRHPVTMTPIPVGSVAIADLNPSALVRLLANGPVRTIRVRVAEGDMEILTPEPETIVREITPYFHRE